MTAGPGLKTLEQWLDELEAALAADDKVDEEALRKVLAEHDKPMEQDNERQA